MFVAVQIIATSRDVTSKMAEISDRSRPKLSQFSDPALGSVLLESPGTLFGYFDSKKTPYLTQIGSF